MERVFENKLLLAMFVLATIFFILVLLLIPFSFIYRYLSNKRRVELDNHLKVYSESISLYITSLDNSFLFLNLDTRLKKQAVLTVLTKLYPQIDEESRQKIKMFARHNQLIEYSIGKLYSRSNKRKLEAFFELNILGGIENNLDTINKYLQSRNKMLRTAAVLSLILISADRGIELMTRIARDISEWEQVLINNLIERYGVKVPRFHEFLMSENKAVLLFSLNMILKYEQKEGRVFIEYLLGSEAPRVRITALRCIKMINDPRSIDRLKATLPDDYDERAKWNKAINLIKTKNEKKISEEINYLSTMDVIQSS